MAILFMSRNLWLSVSGYLLLIGVMVNPALAKVTATGQAQERSPYPFASQQLSIAYQKSIAHKHQNKSAFPVITPTTPAAKEKMAEGVRVIQRGQIPQAIRLFQEAIALDPELWQAHYNLGLAYRQAGDLQKAADAFYKTITLEPRFALGFANLGGILIDVQNWGQAQQYLNRALILEPNLAITHYNFGLIYQQLGRMDAAQQAWETAYRLTPELNEAALHLADLYLQGDRLRDAETLVSGVLSNNARLPAAQYLKGRIAERRGNSEGALTAYRKATTLDPNYANAYYAAARVLMEHDRHTAAQPLLDYALFLYSQQGQTKWVQATEALRQQLFR